MTSCQSTAICCLIIISLLKFVVSGRSYICNENHHCVKGTGEFEYKTQNECRLSCGSYGSLWPQPTGGIMLSPKRVYFDPANVRFNLVAPSAKTQQYLSDNSRLFKKNILKECPKNACAWDGREQIFVKVSVNSDDMTFDWNTNESYNLTIDSTNVTVYVDVRAHSIYGARLGLETLSQLITGNQKSGLVTVASGRISDAPVFKHRGLLLDTARNFIPIRNIRKTLDAMSASKMNILHWHATDSQSFPIEISKLPHLQRLGAYSSEMKYSKSDIEDIIKYARLRGIRVLIEFDGPAHVGNGWQFASRAGLGDLVVCLNAQPWRKFCIQPPCGQFNPINENLYPTLKHLFDDIADMIPLEETIHMGGDEVFIPCWNATNEILDYLKLNGLSRTEESFYRLWSDYHKNNLDIWDEIKSKKRLNDQQPVIVWSSHLTYPDVIEKYFPKNRYIIQTWVGADLPLNTELLQKGYRIIVSTKDAWYLDHGFWGQTTYYNWKRVYQNQIPRDSGVLGGEVCMWSEFVDEQTLDGRIWPRAGAAAERLWSDPRVLESDLEPRFLRYRQRLITRGVDPDAVVPKYCELNEGECF
ncbi:chitooligosaccharidolytic beta-N-acetylglucosaminidase [Condylostylus longicornis]|uniref:chitooligosaccharidolytic beta-N-acetylglucosaminidase n=1 Tax=Condylostylus longicornis TaxID=2530218 RepID=UPI00244DC013|nr:chitooligosaccharidolytic beta-N-acetylglucosaminidase [Condylostylus longicornis]XP_055389855.1 chitooligosaccharidolytic beta-N-acetylglucosaminidase [Condylostylus longicornis]